MHSKFPARTIVLMALTLVAFVWFWWQTHSMQGAKPQSAPIYKVVKVNSLEPVLDADGGAR